MEMNKRKFIINKKKHHKIRIQRNKFEMLSERSRKCYAITDISMIQN